MLESLPLADAQDRLLAETTWDRNVVVIAGAGTGKTTILVNRILNLLLRDLDPLEITEIVALTFTNKAATEMKGRLRGQLVHLADPTDELQRLYTTRYQISSQQIAERARAALAQIEKAQIGTLHSFAAHILRLYPIEAGLDPKFQEDDGVRFTELFETTWSRWLIEELGPTGSQPARWRQVLQGTTPEELRLFTAKLAGDFIDLDEVERQCRTHVPEGPVRECIINMRGNALALRAVHDPPTPRKAELMLTAAIATLTLVLEKGLAGLLTIPQDHQAALQRELGTAPAGWSAEGFAELADIMQFVHRLLTVDQSFFHELVLLVRPFLIQLHQAFLLSGWITFDGLLVRAKALLRDHRTIRTRLKQTYRAILVDEFQDTDPIQYEIVFYLGETRGTDHAEWFEVELEPGKLFIVGDPKQSIFAFRRADLDAFERIVAKLRIGGAAMYFLRTNFRSNGAVLEVVNNVFDRLFTSIPHVQWPNEQLLARPERIPEVSLFGAQLRLVIGTEADEPLNVDAATRAEAEALACWVKQELLPQTTVQGRDGRPVPLQLGHIALIFRTLTHAHVYLDALRRYEVPYVMEGEKHYYRRQEVIDFVNLLRVVDNPADTIALVGVLRSPLAGLTDPEVLRLQQGDALDYLRTDWVSAASLPQSPIVRALYDRLADLHRRVPLVPLPRAMDLIFEHLPILELAGASLSGEQAVANLQKLRGLAGALADRSCLLFTGFVDLMIARVADLPAESERSLSDESLEAIHIMTIHKAKGLEFPVVVLPGLHHRLQGPPKEASIHYDWSSQSYGLELGSRSNLGFILVALKMATREAAEHPRLLYVAMTRARDLLVLSGGETAPAHRDSVLSVLRDIIHPATPSCLPDQVRIGSSHIPRILTPAQVGVSPRRSHSRTASWAIPDLAAIVLRHQHREQTWTQHRLTSRHVSPSLSAPNHQDAIFCDTVSTHSGNLARLIGTCAHAVLERWDFASQPGDIPRLLEQSIARCLPPTVEAERGVVETDLMVMLTNFFASDPYHLLQCATILGREVPFAMPVHEGQLMNGVIDLLYRLDGAIGIVDYKTDNIAGPDLMARANHYRPQAELYSQAVRRALGVPSVSFQVIFLRHGIAIPL